MSGGACRHAGRLAGAMGRAAWPKVGGGYAVTDQEALRIRRHGGASGRGCLWLAISALEGEVSRRELHPYNRDISCSSGVGARKHRPRSDPKFGTRRKMA